MTIYSGAVPVSGAGLDSGAETRARLDALEERGRGYIRARTRRDALAAAASVAAMGCLVVPAAGVVLAFVRPLSVPVLLMAATLLPLAVAAGAIFTRRPAAIDRASALALFDREAGFKDRVAVSNEFLGISGGRARSVSGGGFHAAAVAEAEPWLARALDTPLARPAAWPAVRRALRSRAPCLFASALLLLVALVLSRPVAEVTGPYSGDRAPARLVDDAVNGAALRVPPPEPALAAAIAAAIGKRLGLVDATQRQAERDADRSASRDGASGAEPPNAGTGAGDGPATGAPGTTRASIGGGQGAAGSGGGAGGAGEGLAARETGSGDAAGEGASVDANGGQPPGESTPDNNAGKAANAARPERPAEAQAARRPQERRQPPAEAGQASASAPGSANPPNVPRSSSPPHAEQGGRPAPARPAESNEQQEQSQGSKPGQGSNASNSAQDALKRSRGLSSLLLAVPTVDRLAGTPGQGLSRSTVRRMAPQPRDADAVEAGARGDQNGNAGVVARRPATPHEARLVHDYFTRDAGGRK